MNNQSRSSRHKFWQGAKAPVAIAHRGGAGFYSLDRHRRENTLEVFRNARELGYKYLEIDVTSTADGKVVVLHVTTNWFEKLLHKPSAPNAQKFEQLTYKQLKTILGREIPTLVEVLQSFADTKFLIDTKTDGVVELLAQEIIKSKAYHQVFLNSFYSHRVKKLQEILGNKVTYGLIISRYPRLLNRHLWQLKYGNLPCAGLSAIILPYRYMNKRTIAKIRTLDLKAIAWTLNTRPRILKALALGVDGLMSDDITTLKETLGESS